MWADNARGNRLAERLIGAAAAAVAAAATVQPNVYAGVFNKFPSNTPSLDKDLSLPCKNPDGPFQYRGMYLLWSEEAWNEQRVDPVLWNHGLKVLGKDRGEEYDLYKLRNVHRGIGDRTHRYLRVRKRFWVRHNVVKEAARWMVQSKPDICVYSSGTLVAIYDEALETKHVLPARIRSTLDVHDIASMSGPRLPMPKVTGRDKVNHYVREVPRSAFEAWDKSYRKAKRAAQASDAASCGGDNEFLYYLSYPTADDTIVYLAPTTSESVYSRVMDLSLSQMVEIVNRALQQLRSFHCDGVVQGNITMDHIVVRLGGNGVEQLCLLPSAETLADARSEGETGDDDDDAALDSKEQEARLRRPQALRDVRLLGKTFREMLSYVTEQTPQLETARCEAARIAAGQLSAEDCLQLELFKIDATRSAKKQSQQSPTHGENATKKNLFTNAASKKRYERAGR